MSYLRDIGDDCMYTTRLKGISISKAVQKIYPTDMPAGINPEIKLVYCVKEFQQKSFQQLKLLENTSLLLPLTFVSMYCGQK